MKNIIKILMTDIKELSSLNKKALIIFHDRYEIYDNIITAISIVIFLVGISFLIIGFAITGKLIIGLSVLIFFWWSSLI